jgi:hypothetical protein
LLLFATGKIRLDHRKGCDGLRRIAAVEDQINAIMKEPESIIRTIEEAADVENKRRRSQKKHSVVYSADRKIEIPIYKLGDGTHCLSWYAADGSRCRKTAKDPTLALTLAKEKCIDLWQSNGFGSREDCRVLISMPRVARVRSRNLFESRTDTPDVKFERFIPRQIGWRFAVRRIISSDLTSAQKIVLLYAWERGFESGEFFASLRNTAKDTNIDLKHVNGVILAFAKVGYFERIGARARGTVIYALRWPTGPQATVGLRPTVEQPTGGPKPTDPWVLDPKTVGFKPPKSEKGAGISEADAALRDCALSDIDWIREIVHAQYPNWSIDDLRLQWKLHGAKGERKNSWAKGDRKHFLKAWMPRANCSPRSTQSSPKNEPEWWTDFLAECYPNAVERQWAKISERHPCLVEEGIAWAAERKKKRSAGDAIGSVPEERSA